MSSNSEHEKEGGFSPLSKAFKKNPTTENYVKLRRKHPDEEIEVGITSGYEWLFSNTETLESFGISPYLFDGVLSADENSISELCLLLMERLIERSDCEKEGQSHVASRGIAISDHLVNFLINMMLDSLDWNWNLRIPRDLIVLIRHQIGSERSEWDKKEEIKEKRWEATLAALELGARGISPSYRTIGKELGVNATTVMRWFANKEDARELFRLAKGCKKITRL